MLMNAKLIVLPQLNCMLVLQRYLQILHKFSKKLIYVSTDSVFNGQLDRAYTEMDYPDPLNHYAKTKFLGEKLV